MEWLDLFDNNLNEINYKGKCYKHFTAVIVALL